MNSHQINPKEETKSKIRDFFCIEYSNLDSNNIAERVTELATLIKELKNITVSEQEQEQDGLLKKTFKGDDITITSLQGTGEATLSAYEVRQYLCEYMSDCIYKSVYGKFPEGRAAVYNIKEENTIAPLAKEDTISLLEQLGHTKEEIDNNNLLSRPLFSKREFLDLFSPQVTTPLIYKRNSPKFH